MDNTTEVVFKRLEETQNEFWNVARETGNFLNMLVKICNAQNRSTRKQSTTVLLRNFYVGILSYFPNYH